MQVDREEVHRGIKIIDTKEAALAHIEELITRAGQASADTEVLTTLNNIKRALTIETRTDFNTAAEEATKVFDSLND